MGCDTHVRKLQHSQNGVSHVPYEGANAEAVRTVTSTAVVPLPSATRRAAGRLVVVVLALSLLLGSALEAGVANARPADPVKASIVATKKKKKKAKKKAPCTRWHKVRLKRHGRYVRRHGRIVRVRHCVSRKKREAATVPAPAPAPLRQPGFAVGMNSGPGPLWEAQQMPALHPAIVRFGVDINTKASDLAGAIGGMAARGTQLIPVALFSGRIPSTSEAQNLASWAHAYGPGGTFWAGRSDGAYAMRHIEFGNETNDSYQFGGCGPGCSDYSSRAGQYALRVRDAANAINGPGGNPNVSLLAIGDDSNCNCSQWVDGMFSAVPNLNKMIGGWTAHPYGPKSRYGPILNELVKDTAKYGDTSVPIYITEYGISTDNGRCLSDNYTWPTCLNYAQAAVDMHNAIADMHATYGSRLAAILIFNQRDHEPSGSTSDRESYYGAYQNNFAPKGAYTADILAELAAYRG
jgi:hypothetical protein